MKNYLFIVLLISGPLFGQMPFSVKISAMEGADGLAMIPDKGYVWAGVQGACISLIRVSSDGEVLWTKSVCPAVPGQDISFGSLHIAPNPDGSGSFFVLFRKGAFVSAPDNYLIMLHLDAQGNILWETALPPQKRYGPFSTGSQLLVQPDGKIWAAHGMGFTDAFPDYNQALVYQVDPNGTTVMRRLFLTEDQAVINGLVAGLAETIIGYGALGFAINDGFLLHLDAFGNPLQASRFPGFYFLKDGGAFSNGDLAFMGKFGNRFAFTRIHPDGTPVWAFELPDSIKLVNLRVSSDDHLVLALRKGNQRYWLAKVDGESVEMKWSNQVEDCTFYKTTALSAGQNGSVCVAQTNYSGDLLSRLFSVGDSGEPGLSCPFWPVELPALKAISLNPLPLNFTSSDFQNPIDEQIFTTSPATLVISSCCPSVLPSAIFDLPDYLCAGSTLQLQTTDGACLDDWNWTLQGSNQTQFNQAHIQAVWDFPGHYLIRLEAYHGTCSSVYEDTLSVVEIPDLTLFSSRDTFICPDKPFSIQAGLSGYEEWIWQDGQEGSNRVWDPPQEGIWTLTGKNPDCQITDSLEIKFADCGPAQVFAPNVFTPNDDGINDAWEVYTQSGVFPLYCRVYDRWGNLCYASAEGMPAQWNGFTGRTAAPSGVYVWTFRYRTYTGAEEQRSGDLLLLR
ncbi:MAG: gliding motility-associated C-terminal domain-containing protein [Saprospiraceae bacterium]|nr:gliding motility-associated C-terminal domain-containing protein [Saprospiraceae bacterium]